MFVPLPDGIRIVFVFTLFGKEVTVTIYVTTPEEITAGVLDDAILIATTWWTVTMAANFSQDVALIRVEATDVSTEDGVQRIFNLPTPAPGLVLLPANAANVAFVTSWRTGFAGRSRRGRSYWAGLSEAAVTANMVDPAVVANVLADSNQLRADLLIGGFTQVVASYVSGGVPRVTALATPVTSTVVNGRVDTQRRRLPR